MSDHPISVPSEKQCRRCGLVLPAVMFKKHTGPKGNKDGLHSYCKSCCRKDGRDYYHANHEQEKEKRRQWGAKNKDKVLKKNARWRRAQRKEVIDGYGGKCECCGESRWEFLAIDHIHGGGKKDRSRFKGNIGTFYKWLKDQGFPKDKYRLLCHNCNTALGIYGYCPHKAKG